MKASRPIGVLLLSSHGLAPAGIGRTPSGPLFGGLVVAGVLGVEPPPDVEAPEVGGVADDELLAENWGTMWHAVITGTSAISGVYRAIPRMEPEPSREEGDMSPEKVNFIHTVAPARKRGSS